MLHGTFDKIDNEEYSKMVYSKEIRKEETERRNKNNRYMCAIAELSKEIKKTADIDCFNSYTKCYFKHFKILKKELVGRKRRKCCMV